MIKAGFMYTREAQKKYPTKQLIMLVTVEYDPDGYRESGGEVFVFNDDGEEYHRFLQENEQNRPLSLYGQRVQEWLELQGGYIIGEIPFGEI